MTNDKSAEGIVRGLRRCAGGHCTEQDEDNTCPWSCGDAGCLTKQQTAAADLIKSQAAEIAKLLARIAELEAENKSLAVHGGKYMQIAEERYAMYEKAIKRAEAAEIKLAAHERRTQND